MSAKLANPRKLRILKWKKINYFDIIYPNKYNNWKDKLTSIYK